ncbi:tolA protein [alpha proteobacterium U9-1i]|nr:tolA protein [alpha proteobacterium U9-1i]
MRAGVIVSIVGHIGAVMMTMLAWEARSEMPAEIGNVVPVEIVDVAEESNVQALAEQVPEEETPAPEEAPPAEEEPAPAPTPAPQRRATAADEFDLAAVSGLIDKQKTPGRQRQEGAPSDRNQRSAGLGTAERASMEDRVRSLTRAHLMRCWRMPVDLPEPERLVVTLEFDLNRNGTLNGQPRVTNPRNYTFDPSMRTAVEAAVRAVRQCDPYPFPDDPAVGEHFDTWARLEFTFRPRI